MEIRFGGQKGNGEDRFAGGMHRGVSVTFPSATSFHGGGDSSRGKDQALTHRGDS